MPKDRRYTRKELESLRRADLQSLYKVGVAATCCKSEGQAERVPEPARVPDSVANLRCMG